MPSLHDAGYSTYGVRTRKRSWGAKGVIGEQRRLVYIELVNSRRPVNTNEFSAWRRRHGFSDILIEDMSCAEQVVLFQQAKLVLGTHGAGLTNIIHCKSGTPVVELHAVWSRPPLLSSAQPDFRPPAHHDPYTTSRRRHDIAVPISALDRMMENMGDSSCQAMSYSIED